jgi:hypothetical protein
MLSNIKRVVFYGCSFTVGSELSDYELFPDLTEAEVDALKLKKGFSVYDNFDRSTIDSMDHQKSWARWCADELGLSWENRAKLGSSLGENVFNLERDIINGSIEDTDLIIVGLTSNNRILKISPHGHPESLIFTENDSRWPNKKFMEDYIKHLGTDSYLLYHWVKEIRYLDLLSSKLGGRLFQQYAWATYNECVSWTSPPWGDTGFPDAILEITNDVSNFESIIDPNFSFSTLKCWDNSLPFKHPKLETHKEFGAHVAKQLKLRIDL